MPFKLHDRAYLFCGLSTLSSDVDMYPDVMLEFCVHTRRWCRVPVYFRIGMPSTTTASEVEFSWRQKGTNCLMFHPTILTNLLFTLMLASQTTPYQLLLWTKRAVSCYRPTRTRWSRSLARRSRTCCFNSWTATVPMTRVRRPLRMSKELLVSPISWTRVFVLRRDILSFAH